MVQNRSLLLLEQADWGVDTPMIQGLRSWNHYPLLEEAIETLKLEALYRSRIHGSGHINRVLLMAGLIAWQEDLSQEDVRQYFRAAAYHDVGRVFDGLDLTHGARSAEKLAELTGVEGEPLRELKGAVAAHSQPDALLEETVAEYRPANLDRALELARLLKDADNLDRVRLGDLDPKFLRHRSAQALAEFSHRLLERDQALKAQLAD